MPAQRNLDLFNFSPVPMWVYDTNTFRFMAANHAAQTEYGYTEEEFLSLTIEVLWPKEDLPLLEEMISKRVKKDLPSKVTVRHIKKSGKLLFVDLESRPLNSWGKNCRIVSATDVTRKLRSRKALTESIKGLVHQLAVNKCSTELALLEKDVFRLNTKKDMPTSEIIHFFLSGIEKIFPGMHCSVIRIRNGRMYNWASPSLPKEYTDGIDGVSIGENRGSCGTAAALKKQVIVSDIEHDTRWIDIRNIALNHNLRACWSHPVIDSKGEVIATFGIYYKEIKAPNDDELNIIERSSSLLQVILENRRHAETLNEAALLMEQAQNLAHFGNWSIDIPWGEVQWSDSMFSIFGLKKDENKLNFEAYTAVLHPDDKGNVLRIIREAIAKGENCDFEFRIIRHTGELRNLKSWVQIKSDEGDVPKRVIGACLDITESKKIQQELVASEANLRNLVERYVYVNKATNDAIYDWDIMNNNIEWGDSFYRVFGHDIHKHCYPLEKWIELVHTDDILSLKCSLDSALNDQGQNGWNEEYRLRKSNGQYAHVEENGYILRNAEGKAVRMIGILRDITERKIAKAELEASKNRYSDLFHLSPQPMLVYELGSLKFLDVNRAAVQHYGYSTEEFLSMTLRDIRPSEDSAVLEKIVKEEVKPGMFHSGSARHVKKSGEIIFVNTKGNSISYKGKEARIVVAIDYTDKIKTEQALIRSEYRFKTLIQEGTDLIAILDAEGNYEYISPATGRILGINAEDLMSRNAFATIYEGDRKLVLSQLILLKRQKRMELPPFRLKVHDNEVKWVETIITDMRDDPAIKGIIANSRDVTQRMENELKLRGLLERYNIVSKATSDAIWDVNLLTGEMLWNHAIKGIFGYKEIAFDLNWWQNKIHPDDVHRVMDLIDTHIEQGESRWTSEYRFRCDDGTYKFVLDRGFLIFDNNGQPIRMIGSMQDISATVSYIHTIERRNARLREIAWAQSHLVRAPLSRILGIIPLITSPNTDQETQETLLSYLAISASDLDEAIRIIVEKSQV